MYKLSFNLILSSLHQGGCCCSAHFGYYNCYCNIFNCNCHYSDGKKFTDTEDGYCQYNNFIDHLATMGTGTCHSHWKELACGSRSRIIDLVGQILVFAKISIFFSISNDRFYHITYISSSMEMILPRRLDQWIFTTYSIKIKMDTYQKKSYGTLLILHSVSKKDFNKMNLLQAIFIS